MRTEELEARTKQRQSAAYGQWMSQPTTKVLISLAPPFEHMDALLRSAFEAGFGVGQGSMAIEMLDSMLKPKGRD